MEKADQINIQSLIAQNNPWRDTQNKDWAVKDGSLSELKKAESEGLFSPPKFSYYLRKEFFNKLFVERDETSGVLIIRGPRRIGKTSTLKYIIEEMISEGYSPDSFLYLSLDLDEFFVEINKKRRLRELLTQIISSYKKPGIPLILILDEVTFYKGWARVLKNLVDAGVVGGGIGIIATGSYSLDLGSAKRELSGRFGKLGESCGADLLFSPRRFIEVAESVLDNAVSFRSFFSKKLGYLSRRAGILEYLSGFQDESDNLKYGYTETIKGFLEKYYDDLHQLLLENYFFAGGYPRKIYQTILSMREGNLNVPDARYVDDIYDLLVSDAKKFNLDVNVVRQILSKIQLPSFRVGGDLKLFCDLDNKSLTRLECDKYMEYLTSSGLFSLIPCVTNPSQINHKTYFVNPQDSKFKFVVNDPAVFFSIYFCSRGIRNIFQRANKLLQDNSTVAEFLFESLIISHLHHHPVLKSQRIDNISFILDSKDDDKEGQELLDVFIWYLNFQDKFILVPVEIKFGNVDISQIKDRAKKLKQEYGIKRLIVVTNKKEFEIQEDYVLIPAEIFLLFF